MEMYKRGAKRKRRSLVGKEDRAGAATDIQDYGRPLALISSFKYLGQVLTMLGDDWLEVVAILRKSWWK